MKKEPLTNEDMKALVGHYLTDKFDMGKYAITGYSVDINGDVSILVAKAGKTVSYDAEDLMREKYLRIDYPAGDVPWHFPLLEEIQQTVDKFVSDTCLSAYISAKLRKKLICLFCKEEEEAE